MLLGKYINKYYKKYGFLFIIGALALLCVDYSQLFVPEFLGNLVNAVTSGNIDSEFISSLIRNILLVALGVCLGRVLFRFTLFRASISIEADLRKEMFLKAERLSQSYYHDNKVGSIMSWFTNDLENVEEYLGWGSVTLFDSIFLSFTVIYKMLRLSGALTLISMIPVSLIVIWGLLVEKYMSEKWELRQKAFDEVYDYSQENFTGIRVIKAFVKETQELHAFAKVAKKSKDTNLDFYKTSIIFDVLIEIIIGVVIALIMISGSYFVYCVSTGSPAVIFGKEVILNAGQLVTFIGYFDNLIWPLIGLGQIVSMRSRSKTALGRITNFLDQNEDIVNPENGYVFDKPEGKVEFRNFSFSYPHTKIHSLEDISLTIKPGELVGIVGKIGSGKTTLANSLLKLYNVDKGSIFIDGHDIMECDIHSLRDVISYVPQDNFLFSDKIRNNISFANREASYERLKAAATFADVADNIENFKDGYDTEVGERGTTLSGGQKQRISIARAYMKDAPIMVMDDSVSAVDTKTEETILNNIRERRKGKTTIMIASRVSTVSHMDKIIVLNEGKLEAFDTPENLLKISPTYQNMVYLQKLESEIN